MPQSLSLCNQTRGIFYLRLNVKTGWVGLRYLVLTNLVHHRNIPEEVFVPKSNGKILANTRENGNFPLPQNLKTVVGRTNLIQTKTILRSFKYRQRRWLPVLNTLFSDGAF